MSQRDPLPFVNQHRYCGSSDHFWGRVEEVGDGFIVETENRCRTLLCGGGLAHRFWAINADCDRTRHQFVKLRVDHPSRVAGHHALLIRPRNVHDAEFTARLVFYLNLFHSSIYRTSSLLFTAQSGSARQGLVPI